MVGGPLQGSTARIHSQFWSDPLKHCLSSSRIASPWSRGVSVFCPTGSLRKPFLRRLWYKYMPVLFLFLRVTFLFHLLLTTLAVDKRLLSTEFTAAFTSIDSFEDASNSAS